MQTQPEETQGLINVSFSTTTEPTLSTVSNNVTTTSNGSHPSTAPTDTWQPSNLDVELDNALFYSADDPAGLAAAAAATLPSLAEPCNRTACQLPNCYCDGAVIPGGLAANETPQMLVVAFDGAINMHNYDLYMQLFNEDRRNPNGCPVRATFYLSHRWTDYRQVTPI